MNKFIIFLSLLGLAYGSHFLEGSWVEDQYQRENLWNFMSSRGVNYLKMVFANAASFELEQEISKDGNTLTFSGMRGPLNQYYSSKVVSDNITRTDVDLGELGGLYYATCEFKGNSLVTYFRATDEQKDVIDDTIDVIEVIATNTVNPDTPNKMTYSLKDVASGEKLVQILYKHLTL